MWQWLFPNFNELMQLINLINILTMLKRQIWKNAASKSYNDNIKNTNTKSNQGITQN